MTIVSVIVGNSVITGHYVVGIVIGSISFILALLCFLFNKKIVLVLDRFGNEKTKEGN